MDKRDLEMAGFRVVLDDKQLDWDEPMEWGEPLDWNEPGSWGADNRWFGEEEHPVAPCRTIEVTEEMRAADARERAEREAKRKASITWVSPVAKKAEGLQAGMRGMELIEVEPKRPAVYLFPSARVHSNRREVA